MELKDIIIKDSKSKSVVYCCLNLKTDKVYIGYTQNGVNTRRSSHYWKSNWKNESNNYFHSTLKKHKREDFEWFVIWESNDLEELKTKEMFFIKELKSNDRIFGYNLTTGGEQSYFNDEVKKKISDKAKARNLSGENNPFFGKKHSEETKKNWSKIRKGVCNNLGYKHSDEMKEKLSKIRKETCKNPIVIENMRKAQKSKKIICITTGEKFVSIAEGARKYKIHKNTLSGHLKGKTKTCAKMVFKYLDD